MKPTIIKVGKTLIGIGAEIGFIVLAMELAGDIGKASMLRAVKKVNPKTADEVLNAFDIGINSGKIHGLKKCKLKIINDMCKKCIEE